MTSHPGHNSCNVKAERFFRRQSEFPCGALQASVRRLDSRTTQKVSLFSQIQEVEHNLDNPPGLVLGAVLSGTNGTLAN